MSTEAICEDILSSSMHSVGHLGFVGIAVGSLYLLMSMLTIAFIKSQETTDRSIVGMELNRSNTGRETRSRIFPVFVRVLWLSALIGLVSAGIVTAVPFNVVGGNSIITSVLFSSMKAVQHAVIEGIAFLLMQKGCGDRAASTALWLTLRWALFILVLRFFIYWKQGDVGDALELFMDMVILVFYLSLWLCPSRLLFRRPAVFLYARFWVYFRFAAIVVKVLFFFNDTQNAAACGYYVSTLVLFALLQPLVSYWTLSQDSDWWQGK